MGTETANPSGELGAPRASAASASRVVQLTSADAAIALIRKTERSVVTFVGFSGAGYEDPRAVERAIAEVLDGLSPTSVVICGGATPEGIGAVYPLGEDTRL